MPLVKLYISKALTKPLPSLSVLQQHMCNVWGTQPSTTKLMLFKCDEWTNDSYNEDVYVDIRAYGTFYMNAALFALQDFLTAILLLFPHASFAKLLR